MERNFLKFNGLKTEVLLFGMQALIWNGNWGPDTLGTLPVPAEKVENLGVILDSELSLHGDASRTITTCFGLKKLKKIFLFIPFLVWKQVALAVVMSRIGYCNALYLDSTLLPR